MAVVGGAAPRRTLAAPGHGDFYYTNYVGYQIYNVPLRDLPLVVWYNLDGFLQGAGKLLIFDLPVWLKASGARDRHRGHRRMRSAGRPHAQCCNIRWPRSG